MGLFNEEELANRVLNASLNGIYIYDVPLGRNVFINDRHTELTGYTLKDFNSMDREEFFTLFHPEDGAAIVEHINRLVRTGEDNLEIEYRLRTKDNRWIWCLSRHSVFACDDNGSVSRIIGTFLDITDRKTTEQRLELENREITLVNRILRVFAEATDVELFDRILDIVQEGLASRHGVFGYISEPGHLICPSLSKMLDQCEVADKCIHYPPDKWKGLWARALREKRSFFNNEPSEVPYGHPAIRNNLAAPILFRGEVIGLLNLANKESDYTETDKILLDAMADRIAPLLYAWIQKKLREDERAEAEEALRESEARFRLALKNAPVSVAAQDRDLRYIWAYNQRTAKAEGIIGHLDEEIFAPEEAAHITAIKRRVLEENVEYREQMWFDRPNGRIFLDVCWEPIREEAGQVIGVASATMDLTPIKQAEEQIKSSLAEKEVLLKEIHHRVKNNMQVIASLISLQADQSQDNTVRDVLEDVTRRVRSMAMVHEKLYQSADLARIDFAEYAQSLLNYLWRSYGNEASDIRLTTKFEPVSLPVNKAVPCGLILNELVSNALKHAFPVNTGGEVTVSLRNGDQGQVVLRVGDNGQGLPAGFDWSQTNSLGLRLVQMLAGQIDASVKVSDNKGTEFKLIFEG